MNNDDIEALLNEANASNADAADSPEPAPPAAAAPAAEDDTPLNNDDIEALLDQATASLDEAAGVGAEPAADAKPFAFHDLKPEPTGNDTHTISLIGEVEMDLRIELGRTQMRLEEVLQLRGGSVVALDKLAGDPVDVFANGKLVARGEVLVMNDNFCIRVTELVGA